jgi:hypothetical protein
MEQITKLNVRFLRLINLGTIILSHPSKYFTINKLSENEKAIICRAAVYICQLNEL